MLMRIDIPVVGLLDRLVLYTDIDILFQQPVDWETMLGNSTLFTEENIKLYTFWSMVARLVCHASLP